MGDGMQYPGSWWFPNSIYFQASYSLLCIVGFVIVQYPKSDHRIPGEASIIHHPRDPD